MTARARSGGPIALIGAMVIYFAMLLLAMYGTRAEGQERIAPTEQQVIAVEFPPPAIRYLKNVYTNQPVEAGFCIIGWIHGDTAQVAGLAPMDVKPGTADAEGVGELVTSCTDLYGREHTIGTLHTHPPGVDGTKCSHFLHGTLVGSSDLHAFIAEGLALSVIYCGTEIVWIDQLLTERSGDVP